MNSLGVGVIGLGVGEQHARAYVRTGRCALRWVYDLDRSRAEPLAAELGSVAAESLDQILSDTGVDAVSIASWDDAHAGQVMAAFSAGKHVFVEKPLCRSYAEASAVKASWLSSPGRHLASNLVLRAAPLYQWLRGIIGEGRLGEIYAFDGDYLYGRLHKITDGWRKDVLDYSVMVGGGIHLVDLMLWLTGQRPEKVTAVGSQLASRGSGFRYHDFAASTYRFRSGLVGRVTANFGCVHRHQHVVRIFGTAGTFIYDDQGARLHESRDPGAAPSLVTLAPVPASKGDLIPGFVDSILAEGDVLQSGQHEFDLLGACLASDRALVTGQEETVEYI
jgi:predicted dehydrogenase